MAPTEPNHMGNLVDLLLEWIRGSIKRDLKLKVKVTIIGFAIFVQFLGNVALYNSLALELAPVWIGISQLFAYITKRHGICAALALVVDLFLTCILAIIGIIHCSGSREEPEPEPESETIPKKSQTQS
ncbi:hypothetical protein V8E51_002146 [Hyaloscypha variabilis]|uniref:Uncharacterized protein n=1 Tax=Hyaloscypha variabilis (strain UAMH 11265 / GT02V1 / F) TaxID=1149755 RepID=A0A2J6RAL4_HYAVF|nr:hypothetical protein L207DRAFT_587856 [Hyaloscypha variabilis F]